MKNIVLVFTLLISLTSFSQENKSDIDSEKKNELRINMSNLIAFKWVDISYERVLNEESSIGVSTLFTLDNETDGLDEYRTFSFTPYYRHFFSKKYAQGFFVEAFGMLHSGRDEYYFYNDDFSDSFGSMKDGKYTDFAVGVSAGAKFVTKRGFVAEFYLGIGRDLLDESDLEVVGRGGLAIGYRF